jgi:tetratricopeptide (TPR) repeat protein
MRLIGCITAFTLAFAAAPAAAHEGAGGATSPFTLGAGARTIAMGGAAAAVWGGSWPLMYNPAGLGFLERGELSAFHTPLFDSDAAYSSAVAAYPLLDMGTFALGIMQLSVDGIERRDETNLISGDPFGSSQTRYLLGYSRTLLSGLTLGVDFKLDRFSQGGYTANGFGFDAGLGFDRAIETPLADRLSLGLCAINIVEPLVKVADEESGDPRGVRAGLAVSRPIAGSGRDRLTVAVDIEKARYGDVRLHAGLEYRLLDRIAARGGWDAGDAVFGFGFEAGPVALDYAFRTSDLDDYHLFSISVGFGTSIPEKLARRREQREQEIRLQIETEIERYEGGFVEDALTQARTAFGEGRYTEAAGLYERVLMLEPENEEARAGSERASVLAETAAADSLYEAGDYAEALLVYRRSAGRIESAGLDERIASCEAMIARAADRRRMLDQIFARGLEQYSNRDWEGAYAAFRELLDIEPDHALARSYLVKTGGRIEEDRVRALRRIDERLASGRFAEAVDLARSGVSEHPGDADFSSRLDRAERLRAQDERRRTAAESAAVQTGAPAPEELEHLRPAYEKGVAYFRDGKYELAIQEWEPVWREYPQYEKVEDYLVKAYQFRGMVLYSMQRYDEAIAVWERVLAVDAGNEKALRYIRRTKEEIEQFRNLKG